MKFMINDLPSAETRRDVEDKVVLVTGGASRIDILVNSASLPMSSTQLCSSLHCNRNTSQGSSCRSTVEIQSGFSI